MQQTKVKGFQCKADRAKDEAIAKRYGSIGIKSVQAAQPLCNMSKSGKFAELTSQQAASKPH